jgi:hypothetical protein
LRSVLASVTGDKNEQEKRLEVISGGSIELWSLDNPDAARGRKYALVVIDEAAMIPTLEQAWQQSIRPTLTDLQGCAWIGGRGLILVAAGEQEDIRPFLSSHLT